MEELEVGRMNYDCLLLSRGEASLSLPVENGAKTRGKHARSMEKMAMRATDDAALTCLTTDARWMRAVVVALVAAPVTALLASLRLNEEQQK